ncbi:hypothetical protein HPP92_026674, partial [Vanilla planifolia]
MTEKGYVLVKGCAEEGENHFEHMFTYHIGLASCWRIQIWNSRFGLSNSVLM